jgi:hypothetical protein
MVAKPTDTPVNLAHAWLWLPGRIGALMHLESVPTETRKVRSLLAA